ncbi:MAG: MerR family transcriptional regulator [Vulcanimicrobiaceae bacterium]
MGGVIDIKEGLTIGEAAQLLDLSEDTLGYYERADLTPPVERASSGHRRYSEEDLRWFSFVVRMRATGMPIATLQRYAALTRQGEHIRLQLAERFWKSTVRRSRRRLTNCTQRCRPSSIRLSASLRAKRTEVKV